MQIDASMLISTEQFAMEREMTDVAVNDPECHLGLGQSLWNIVRDAFRIGTATQVTAENIAQKNETDHIADLMEKIENGYIVEETGGHARIPRYARAHLKTLAGTGGWG
jgi:hypothetical protein